eukprot:s835_g13.t1
MTCHCRPGLVIYAPRRGLLELWQLCSKGRTPKRIAASCAGSECLLLSQAGRACLLWPTGQVDRLVWPLGASTSPTSRDDDAFDSADSDVGESSEVDPAKQELNRTMQQKEISEKVLRNTNHEKKQLQEP